MYESIFAGLIVFFASVLQASTGFGFAIMATPFLLLVFDSRDCIQISIFLSLFIALILMPKIKHEIDLDILKRLIHGSILGIPIGLGFFIYVSLDILKASVSAVILMISIFLIIKWYQTHFRKTVEGPIDKTKECKDAIEADQNSILKVMKESERRNEVFVGLTAGILTTSLGMPGVPLAIYFTAQNVKKETIRSTTLAFFIVVYIVSIIMQVFSVKISTEVLFTSLYLIPTAAVGVFLGNILFYKINQRMFQLIANLILIYTGFYIFYKTLL
ncbi:protein of unknown function DUF81 [Desulforamulus reducens MI-1]|uniref:Probable membrane transporter protein n=1 Tax=Desulforamulus reducens (strain ATCC BAA-1160 / DSM 100696 / MI-1) TaxID=349161 RepID=A4J849_DESRM|nr:sulfite exporter TauE/SafE family protein [Desulforamulus reducens]ABO51252.1 protein of unknown function DUF81 [Desulforamulus reducens MI-1]